MKTYIGSDFHWHHKNILKHCPTTRARYPSVEAMNTMMVEEWNSIVNDGDLVYMLGDIAFCNAEEATRIMKSLNGDKILVKGNHDEKLLKSDEFRGCFKEVHQYLEVKHNNHHVVMFHYPIFDHNRAGHGSIMLHGHRHGNSTGIEGRIMDVGMDATGSILVDFDEVVNKLSKVPHMYHHDPVREAEGK